MCVFTGLCVRVYIHECVEGMNMCVCTRECVSVRMCVCVHL